MKMLITVKIWQEKNDSQILLTNDYLFTILANEQFLFSFLVKDRKSFNMCFTLLFSGTDSLQCIESSESLELQCMCSVILFRVIGVIRVYWSSLQCIIAMYALLRPSLLTRSHWTVQFLNHLISLQRPNTSGITSKYPTSGIQIPYK